MKEFLKKLLNHKPWYTKIGVGYWSNRKQNALSENSVVNLIMRSSVIVGGHFFIKKLLSTTWVGFFILTLYESKYFHEMLYKPCIDVFYKGYDKINTTYQIIYGKDTTIAEAVVNNGTNLLLNSSKDVGTDNLVGAIGSTVIASASKEGVDLLNKGVITLDHQVGLWRYGDSLIKDVGDHMKKIILDYSLAHEITHITRDSTKIPLELSKFMHDMHIGSLDVNIPRLGSGNDFSLDWEKAEVSINQAGLINSGWEEFVSSSLFYGGVGTLIFIFLGPSIAISSGVSVIALKGSAVALTSLGVKHTGLLWAIPKITAITSGVITYTLINKVNSDNNITDNNTVKDNENKNKENIENNE